MPPGEIAVVCPGCDYRLRLPIAAVRRNNFYCPQCGKNIPLGNVLTAPDDAGTTPTHAKTRRSSRPTKRR